MLSYLAYTAIYGAFLGRGDNFTPNTFEGHTGASTGLYCLSNSNLLTE